MPQSRHTRGFIFPRLLDRGVRLDATAVKGLGLKLGVVVQELAKSSEVEGEEVEPVTLSRQFLHWSGISPESTFVANLRLQLLQEKTATVL